jgi:cytochrome c oxidase subunit 1
MVENEVAFTVATGFLLVSVLLMATRLKDWRRFAPTGAGGSVQRGTDVQREKPTGALRWLTTVDHKDIGILYGVYSVVVFGIAGVQALLMRLALTTPQQDLITNQVYNALLTSHGISMLILFGTPILAAFSNYFIPLLIGADDMAFPRINAIAFWLLPPSALLVYGGFLVPGLQGAQTAWTLYPPLSAGLGAGTQAGAGVDLMLLGLHLSGISVTMGAINFIVTIFTERAEKVSWANLDIFSWTVLTQSGLVLFAFPLLGSAILMLLLDRNFGTTFFAVGNGGPILWQHLFWFWGHPEVYILILPAMGLASLILPRFSGRRLFGFKFVVYSTLAIGTLSFGVWAHHMFATGIDPRLRASFMAVSLAIAIPTAVKTFNWVTTMWNGHIRLTAPMLFCVGFVSNVIIGGVTGVFLASIPIDIVLHDTYYVVGHFHYFLMGGTVFTVFAGIYYWFPLVTKKMYQRTLARWHFWLSLLGVNVTFFAMILLGYGGMPRRYATYLEQFVTLHQLTTLGAIIITVAQLIWLYNMVVSWREGPAVTDGDPWDLERWDLKTAEWEWFEQELTQPLPDGGDSDGSDTDSDR